MLELRIKPNTLNDQFRNKEKIIEQYNSSNRDIASKKFKESKYSLLDKSLLEFFKNLRALKKKVNGPIIQAKADELAIKLGVSGSSCGTTWLQQFKQRNNIVWQAREHGEADSVDHNTV